MNNMEFFKQSIFFLTIFNTVVAFEVLVSEEYISSCYMAKIENEDLRKEHSDKETKIEPSRPAVEPVKATKILTKTEIIPTIVPSTRALTVQFGNRPMRTEVTSLVSKNVTKTHYETVMDTQIKPSKLPRGFN